MHPSHETLERLSLGLLSDEELPALEEHLETCQECLQTMLEIDPPDVFIEALRAAPQTMERRAEIAHLIPRVEAAALAQLRDPYSTHPETTWGGLPRPSRESDDTSGTGSGLSTFPPAAPSRTAPDGEEMDYSFLAPAASPDELGRLGAYRVLRVLGTGGMGMVFEAEDPQLKRRLALKVMKPGIAVNVAARKRFLREAQTAAAVEHDHIVSVYQVGEDRCVPFIAMPLLRGETLAERLESAGNALPSGPRAVPWEDGPPGPSSQQLDGLGRPSSRHSPLPNEELARIGREIALGLAAAHRRGLIHRDIKPSNIWLEEETGRVKILDFGLARVNDGGEQLTHSGSVLGTPAYMSPEQASGIEADARSDLFSLGCVLYHCATGRRPFAGRDALSTLVAVTTTEPPPPRELNPALPDEISDLIVALLVKDRDQRLQTAREVAERLAAAGNGVPCGPHGVPAAGTAILPLPPGEGRGEGGLQQVGSGDAAELLPLPPDPQAGAPSRGEGGWQQKTAGVASGTSVRGATHPHANSLPEGEGTRKPPRRRGLVMLCAAAVAAAILAGIIITIKNEKGETIATIKSAGPIEVDAAPGLKAIIEETSDDKTRKAGAPVVASPPPVATDHGPLTTGQPPTPNSQPLPPMSAMSLVTEPTPIPGAKSWTLETLDHRGEIYKMEFNPDGTLLATYGEDGAVRLWNAETGELARIFIGADSPAGGIAWSPDGAEIAVAAGGTIKAWQAASGKPVRNISLVGGEAASLAWSPDGKTFAVGQRPLDRRGTDLADALQRVPIAELCLYDAASGERTAVRRRDDWNLERIAWSPDSKTLLASGEKCVSFLIAAEQLDVHAIPNPSYATGEAAVAWTAAGTPLLARGGLQFGEKNVAQLWRAQPAELLHTLATELEGEQSAWGWTALSSDGRFVVAGCKDTSQGYPSERAAYVYDAATGKIVAHINHSAEHPDPWDSQKEAAPIRLWEYDPRYAISRDGKRLARCGRQLGGPDLFDLAHGTLRHQHRRLATFWVGNSPFCAEWSPSGESLAFRGEDGTIRYLSARAAWPTVSSAAPAYVSPAFHPFAALSLRWSRDGSRITVAYSSNARIDTQSALTGETEARRELPVGGDGWHGRVYAPVFSFDGRRFAGHFNWHAHVLETAGSKMLKTLDALTGEPVTWSPDGGQVATRNDNATEIWDIEANECVWRSVGKALLVWSSDGSRFVLSGSGEMTIHDAASGNVLHELDEPPAGASVWPRLSWSPDSRRIAGRGRIWDAETGEVVARLPRAALAGETGAPAWSPDGATLAYLGPGRAVVVADVAPKVRHSTAQGETLGNVPITNHVALKGRDSDDAHHAADPANATESGESRPDGEDGLPSPSSNERDGPGGPSSRAMLLTFNRGQVLSISPSGHYRASPRADELLVYVVETAAGQETLTREQFAERFGWKNDPAWAIKVAPTLRGGDAVAKGDRLAPPSRSAESTEDGPPGPSSTKRDGLGRPSSSLALVQRPAALPGVESWTIAARSLRHHQDTWQPIDLSRDGKMLAQAGEDGVVGLIDTATGKVERRFSGHDEPLAAIEFSPDGKLVASLGSVVGNVRIWDAAAGKLIHSVYVGGGDQREGALHWSPDGALLAVSVVYAPLRLIDVASGEFLPQPIGYDMSSEADYFAWSPDGRRFVCAGSSRDIRIWETATLEPLRTLESKFDISRLVAFAWSPDGKAIAAYANNGEIRVWDPATGKLLKSVQEKQAAYAVRIAWLPDNRTIAINVQGEKPGWRLWDVADGRPVGDVVPFGSNICGFSLGQGSETLAMGDQRIGLFDVRSRTLKREIGASPYAQSAAWSPDSRELAVTGDDMAVWSNNKQRGLATLPAANLIGAAWLPNGNAILNPHDPSGSRFDRMGAHWNAKPMQFEKDDYGGYMTSAVSPDGTRLASSNISVKAEDAGKRRVEIWDLGTAKRLVQTEPLATYIHALAWAPNGELLAAGTDDGKAAIYDAATGKCLAALPEARAEIRPIEFSPDGKTLAAGYGGNENGFVRLYEVGNLPLPEGEGTNTNRPHPSPLPEGEGARVDADGNPKSQIENPQSDGPPEQKADGTRSVPATLTLICELACSQGPQAPEIAALHWSPDGRRLKVLDGAAVYVFDTATGERLAEAPRLDRTPHEARPANFSPDGRFLAVATTCTRVWDLAELDAAARLEDGPPGPSSKNRDGLGRPSSLKLVASVVPLGHRQWMVVGADGHWLGTRGAEKEIVYVIQSAAGQQSLTPREFYKRFNWKNDPNKVVLP